MENMRKSLLILSLCLLPVFALSAQEQEEPDVYEVIEKETERLTSLLELEDWQVFYVDSTLAYKIPMMQQEMMKLQRARVNNRSLYQSVQDKWMEATDRSYQKFFSETQWQKYLKSGAERAQRQRDKRKGQVAKKNK